MGAGRIRPSRRGTLPELKPLRALRPWAPGGRAGSALPFPARVQTRAGARLQAPLPRLTGKGLGDGEMSRDEKPDRFRLRIATERPVLHELNQPELRLGTDPACELHIKHDRSVSPVHATFYLRDGEWCLRDEGSRAGIVPLTAMGPAGRTRVTGLRGLAPGQVFRFGKTDVVFERIRRAGELCEPFCGMVGTSAAFEELKRQILFAARATRVMVFGRTGTGKELVARAVHANSERKGKFVALNCASLSETLVENELFGHEKGAFTGADTATPGLFHAATEGTLFLDEIGELPRGTQAKVLRVLEQRAVRRVGGTSEEAVDVLVVGGGQASPQQMLERDVFREDFFYRLATFAVQVPDLDARVEDIVPLVLHFTALLDKGAGLTWTAAALERVKARRYPGNVRELQNFVELAVAFGLLVGCVGLEQVEQVERQPAFAERQGGRNASSDNLDAGRKLAEVQAERVQQALRRHHGNLKAAGAELGVHRTTLQRMLKRQRRDEPRA